MSGDEDHSPRDRASFSELVPLASGRIDILRSRAFLPLVATGLACCLLFAIGIDSREAIGRYIAIVAGYGMFVTFVALYVYAGERKSLFWYLWPALVTLGQLVYLWPYYDQILVALLPVGAYPPPPEFLRAFPVVFVVVGLREEIVKALPILISFYLATSVRPGEPSSGFALRGPLDGVLMGAAAGAVFTFDETVNIYVPRTVASVLAQTGGDQGLANLYGLALLIPRLLNAVIGHVGLAGVFGYFIGLAVCHPAERLRLVGLGLLAAATLHTLYDTLHDALGSVGYWLTSAAILVSFLACLLKARQLDLAARGVPASGHSVFTAFAAPDPVAALPLRLAIGIGPLRYALETDRSADLASLFPAAAIPADSAVALTFGPAGRAELTNRGQTAWMAVARDGASRIVPPGSAVLAESGLILALGSTRLLIERF